MEWRNGVRGCPKSKSVPLGSVENEVNYSPCIAQRNACSPVQYVDIRTDDWKEVDCRQDVLHFVRFLQKL